jgi:hypothetical protein
LKVDYFNVETAIKALMHGKHIYSHRVSTLGPVFANIGTNKGLKWFGFLGKAKIQGKWQLYCVIHNIGKFMRYGDLAR